MQLTVIHVREDVWTWGHLDVDITADVIFLWAFPLQRGVGQTGSPVHHRTRFRPTLLILDVSYCGKKLPYRVFNDRHLLLKSMIYRHLQYCAINMLYVYYSIFYHAFYIYFIYMEVNYLSLDVAILRAPQLQRGSFWTWTWNLPKPSLLP